MWTCKVGSETGWESITCSSFPTKSINFVLFCQNLCMAFIIYILDLIFVLLKNVENKTVYPNPTWKMVIIFHEKRKA